MPATKGTWAGDQGDQFEEGDTIRYAASLAILGLVLALVSGCASTTGETTGEYVDDAATTASVKAKLAGDEGFKTLTRVTVETVRGTVYLTGVVDTPEAKERATDIAWRAKGVRGVVTNLPVRG